MTKLLEIEGIGPANATRLEGVGVTSIEQLLKDGASVAGRRKLAADSGINEDKLLEWVNHADLLEAAGVDTVPELSTRNAENLHAKMAEVNAAKKLVRRDPSLSEVERWIGQAKTLDRVVTH